MQEKMIADMAYLKRMGCEPSAYDIVNWVNKSLQEDHEVDGKYLRRLIEALIVVKGGTP